MTIVSVQTDAFAQSAATFATMPYSQNTPATAPVPVNQAPVIAAPSAAKYRGPPPVVMFRGTPPPSLLPTTAPAVGAIALPSQEQAPLLSQPLAPPREYSIVSQAARDAANAGWSRASLDPVVAPAIVPGMQIDQSGPSRQNPVSTDGQKYRGPMRRIFEDTRKGIVHGIPEAVADALPWVDRDASHEPFNNVLARAADDLNRAALGDPNWALPAQQEIRALSRRLDSLSAPPTLAQSSENLRPIVGVAGVDDRPFRPRPIWPGASGRPEDQVRPVTLVTSTGQEQGPQVNGVVARYVPAVEDDDGAPEPKVAPPKRNNVARGTPRPRRGARSR
jgi:hypothetical protein